MKIGIVLAVSAILSYTLFPTQGDLLLSVNSPEDDYHPDITKDGDGNIIVTWTHGVLNASSFLAYSSDEGKTWNSIELPFEGSLKYPQVAFMQGSKYIDSCWDGIWYDVLDVSGEGGYFMMIGNITDMETWDAYLFEMGRPGATYLSVEDDMWFRQVSYDKVHGPVIGMINDYKGMNQGIMLWWIPENFAENALVFNWDSGTGPLGSYFPAFHIDMAPVHDVYPAQTENDFFYIACHTFDEKTGKSKILYKKCVPEIEDDIEFVEEQGYLDGGEYDAKCPEIEASEDNVAIIYMTNENGDWDVKCLYSYNRGRNWSTSFVANESGVNETYPSFCMLGTNIYCGYIKRGNLYLVESNDGGATWGSPKRINNNPGSVVSEENSMVVHPAGIVWTDNRDENKDIYFARIIPEAPLIKIKIRGGFRVKAEIKNIGNAPASNVKWNIQLIGGLILLGRKTSGIIPTLPPGEAVTIESNLIFGFGKTRIVVTADNAGETTDAVVVLFFVNL